MVARSKQLTKWDEELAKYAQEAAATEAAAGGSGQYFSLKGGILSWQDEPLPGNQMVVVVLASMFENVWYHGEYDPDVRENPTCFALSNEYADLTPHENVVEAGQAQSLECKSCELNKYGTADKGRGKACRNTRRLGMIPAGTITKTGSVSLFKKQEDFTGSAIGYMRLPVTSVRNYGAYVSQLNALLKRPPFAVATKVTVVPDAKTQFAVNFEVVETLGDDFIEGVMAKREEAEAGIAIPYEVGEAETEEKPKPATQKKTVARKKTATRKRVARKY
jgi:hypothetical protein